MTKCPQCEAEFRDDINGACDLADHYYQVHVPNDEKVRVLERLRNGTNVS